MIFDELVHDVLNENSIPGGLADDKSVYDIATKYDVTVKKVKQVLDIGAKVELEHTNDIKKAYEIAKDHVYELGIDYYKELDKMEKRLKLKNK